MPRALYFAAGVLVAASAITVSSVDAAMLDVIEKRMEIMKGVGKAAKAAKPMFKDSFVFEPKAAAAQMAIIAKAAVDVVPLFPVGSETGGAPDKPTTVLPAIWQDKQDFNARLAKMADDAKAAVAAAAVGHAAFKPAFLAVVKNCKGCHEKYRQKKK